MADLTIYDCIDTSPVASYIMTFGELRHYRKRDQFSRIDTPTPELGLVTEGAFAFSHHDHKGNDQILSLAFPGELIGAYITPSPGRRSCSDITALIPSAVMVVPVSQLNAYLDRELPGFRLGFIEAIAVGFLQRAISYRCHSPEMRYRQLTERIPGIEHIIPMTAIASYLGITREAFARMRRRMAAK